MRAVVRSVLVDSLVELCTDIEIAVSELVSNAVEHARSAGTLTITLHSNGAVLVEVSDDVTSWAERHGDVQPGGRGLGIVDTVASHWDIEWGTKGKVIWAWFSPNETVVGPRISATN